MRWAALSSVGPNCSAQAQCWNNAVSNWLYSHSTFKSYDPPAAIFSLLLRLLYHIFNAYAYVVWGVIPLSHLQSSIATGASLRDLQTNLLFNGILSIAVILVFCWLITRVFR